MEGWQGGMEAGWGGRQGGREAGRQGGKGGVQCGEQMPLVVTRGLQPRTPSWFRERSEICCCQAMEHSGY
eukprot:272239-Rhodomonas_salina.2